MTLTHAGGILVGDWSPWLVVSPCAEGHAGFFPEMKKRMAHHMEPTNQESNLTKSLIKLLVPYPLENLYTLSFGFSPQRFESVTSWGYFWCDIQEKIWLFQCLSEDTKTAAVNWLSFECADDIAGSM